jgi:hypothetical protein
LTTKEEKAIWRQSLQKSRGNWKTLLLALKMEEGALWVKESR